MTDYEISIDFVMKDGRTVQIFLDDSGEGIRIEDPSANLVGRIDLRLIDGEDQRHDCYFITWMYLDLHDSSYTRKGIGRAALSFHREIFRCRILVADNDGITRDDGSHLTGDAPGFVQQMLKEGIISKFSADETDDGG